MKNTFLSKYGFLLAASGLFLVLLLFIFRNFVFDSSTLMLNSDQLNGIGSRILRAENAVVTEWDDSRLGGVPTIDALFADVYHPLVWVQFITDPARAVGFKFILTIWVAFCSAMLLAKTLTKNNGWAALLGFLYALSPQYFTYIYGGHDGKMMVFAIAPLAILAIRKIIREGKLSHVFVLAFSIVWMILGSHLQLTYLFLWGAGFYALYETFALAATKKRKIIRLSATAVALGFGLLVSAFQLLPPYLYTTKDSVRGTAEKTNYGHAVSWSLHQEELGALLIPGFIGVDVYEQDSKTGEIQGSSLLSYSPADFRNGSPFYWGHNAFKLNHDSCGTILTFLAFLCFFVPGKRRYAAFWFVGTAIALSYAMGAHSPLFRLWYEILPGVKNFRAPSMALFWLPLAAVMMAAPVLKSVTDPIKNKHLGKGVFLFGVLLVILTFARFNWELFLGPVGLVLSILYGILFVGTIHLADKDKDLTVQNFLAGVSATFEGSSKITLFSLFLPFFLIGIFFLSGQNIIENPQTAPYFKPLNLEAMQAGASKMIPSLILVIVLCGLTFFVIKNANFNKRNAAIILAIGAAVELFLINGAFVQNVPRESYIQPKNRLVAAIKQTNDSLSIPRVLSISRNQALSGNIFPAYGLRNAGGFHDNELASYQAFRGGPGNANYMIGLDGNDKARPFLDLANIGSIIFDTRQGTTFMPNPTALGEAFLYGNWVVMDDASAIETLKTAEIRKPAVPIVTDSLTQDSTQISVESKQEEPQGFLYRETIILSEKPQKSLNHGIPVGSVKLVSRPKMDTQVFEVESDRDAILFVSGNYHPYWKAYVNEQPVKVIKAFSTFKALEIPKGKSTVRLEYRSDPFHLTLKISLAAIILLVALGIVYAIHLKKKLVI